MANTPLYSFKCGYCKNKVSGRVKAFVVFKPGQFSVTIEPGKDVHYQGLVECPTCLNHTFIDFIYNSYVPIDQQRGEINSVIRVINIFPEYPEPKVSVNIPEKIAIPFIEAQKTLNAEAYSSTVIQCRKTIEFVCKHFNATGSNLKEMIDDLYRKGLIISAIRDWAHVIREFGNASAHQDTISPATAKEIFDFTSLILYLLFDIPDRVSKLRQQH